MLDKYSFMSLFCYCFVWVTSWKATFLWSESPRPVFFMKSIVLNSQHVGLTPRVLFYTSIFARFSANVAWTTRNVFLSLNSMRQMLYASNAGQKPSLTGILLTFHRQFIPGRSQVPPQQPTARWPSACCRASGRRRPRPRRRFHGELEGEAQRIMG